jgi:putative ABC transport system permease protein
VGDTFQPSHDIVEEEEEGHKHDAFTVVGVLEPTGTPNDRAIFINIEGFYLLEGHAKSPATPASPSNPSPSRRGQGEGAPGSGDQFTAALTPTFSQREREEAPAHSHDDHAHEHHTPLPEDQREVTAILVLVSTTFPGVEQVIYNTVNEGQVAQAVFPIREVQSLFHGIVGPIRLILLVLTVMIVIVSGVGILVSIYNSMSDRRHDIAVMRALGARRGLVMSVILVESVLISLVGGAAGVVLGHAAVALASPAVTARTGVTLNMLRFEPQELVLIPALVLLAALAGFLPAITAYRTDVGRSLSATP